MVAFEHLAGLGEQCLSAGTFRIRLTRQQRETHRRSGPDHREVVPRLLGDPDSILDLVQRPIVRDQDTERYSTPWLRSFRHPE